MSHRLNALWFHHYPATNTSDFANEFCHHLTRFSHHTGGGKGGTGGEEEVKEEEEEEEEEEEDSAPKMTSPLSTRVCVCVH